MGAVTMFDDFLVRAAFAGIGVALATAPLGCFVVWRRMAYFGDATAHAALMGVAFSLLLGAPLLPGIMIAALLVAVGVAMFAGKNHGTDTILGVLAHVSLAIGLVAVSLVENMQVDLNALLFGDILTVTKSDLVLIWGGGAIVVALLCWRWRALLVATLSPDMAIAAGVNPRRETVILTFALALVVAVAIKVVGALLIASMLIIPAAAARPLSSTPERMAMVAAGIGVGAALLGLSGAFRFDTPAGPSIVCVAGLAFLGTRAIRRVLVN